MSEQALPARSKPCAECGSRSKGIQWIPPIAHRDADTLTDYLDMPAHDFILCTCKNCSYSWAARSSEGGGKEK